MLKRMRRRMERGFRGFPFFEEEEYERSLWEPFENMVKMFEGEIPEDLKDFVKEEETPSGKVRRFGPFVYGFSYSKRPGEEPQIQEFGNIRQAGPGRVVPASGGEREPLTEVVDLNGVYEITVEIPGVEKEEIDLSATEETLSIETTGERKYQKKVSFEEPVDPDKVDANFRNGILTIEVEKKEKEKKEKKKVEVK
ncbi:hypothetical protein AKJ58_00410 [candidate division MSBL1 archaeon SCGC-AAA385D11]|uniref:SHSP domain-containing protein n=1 Tax=candidate division MSBL1 archaeon SCGC-AAA385D11 TaxID=1698286 RepID=A0A133VP78_9EURY|nr:hypothetical protein AKJ58_00410 [candidate division MSBL1 archaeon SCGC-AAA385D11]